ncbi:KpsF/GutQ family sugar-phosphate isomerase [Sphingomonas quercus]|uniref:KpsF/GutQ family sugar-phosphate isomerase n=1 Tax=Sphingomonas quercus TaxID=2842451 RepID=A0ABS6BM23_9SPHN|nr:KpsF/GutQ family sugar-phosphate isomerase [Sphingomonas quercus]MBU3078667.1 KpsF/GutQ family sugar-phosphate isomerase [Sphingomonas quercus]
MLNYNANAFLPLEASDTGDELSRLWFRDVLAAERDALDQFLGAEHDAIPAIVALVAAQERPIVCLGIGKSGLVAAKVAATFSSLGTSAFFLNAAEAAHGDLGAVQTENVVLLFSNSGTTEEIMRILPILKARRCRLIGIIGRAESPLAQVVEHCVLMNVRGEADHIGMAPTCSTTLQMAIGDALAVAVSRARGFTRDDFLRHHPAGLLGRHMIPIRDLMRKGADLPTIGPDASVADMITVISAQRMGAVCVVDHAARLLGLVVDGDVRRLIESRHDIYSKRTADIMCAQPITVRESAVVADVLMLLQQVGRPLSVVPVVDDGGRLCGMIQSYDLLRP